MSISKMITSNKGKNLLPLGVNSFRAAPNGMGNTSNKGENLLPLGFNSFRAVPNGMGNTIAHNVIPIEGVQFSLRACVNA